MSTFPALTITNLSYAFPNGTHALSEISFRVAEGEKVALIGPNGAGKSTLFLHLNGLYPEHPQGPSSIQVFGRPVEEPHLGEIRAEVGMLFQHPDDQLFCPTIFEDIAFGPQQKGIPEAELEPLVRASLLQAGLEIPLDRSPDELSQGEKRRVCLAGILACSPRILVFDEPTSDLDPRGKRQLKDLLRQFPHTLLVASHDLDWLIGLCSRVLVLNHGRLIADGPTADILGNATLMEENGLEVPFRLIK